MAPPRARCFDSRDSIALLIPSHQTRKSALDSTTRYELEAVAVTNLLLERVLSLLLPMPCLGCERLIRGGRHYIGLCGCCRGRLTPLGGDRCGGCGRPLRGVNLPVDYRCGSCRRSPRAYDRLIALWVFKPPMDSVIHGLKFQRLDYLGRHLAREMAARVRTEVDMADLVVWIPLHWRRYLSRGYNQAERIARPLAGQMALAARPVLARTRATPAQTSLARERREANVRGALRVRRRARVVGKRILLVDDVTTTGSTLQAAAVSLRSAGAARITAVTAARTPGTDEPYARRTVIW